MLTDKPGFSVLNGQEPEEKPETAAQHDNDAILEMYLNRLVKDSDEEPGEVTSQSQAGKPFGSVHLNHSWPTQSAMPEISLRPAAPLEFASASGTKEIKLAVGQTATPNAAEEIELGPKTNSGFERQEEANPGQSFTTLKPLMLDLPQEVIEAAPVVPSVEEVEAGQAPEITLTSGVGTTQVPLIEAVPAIAGKKEATLLNLRESWGSLFRVLIASLPVLLIALGLRFWDINRQSAFMDEASNIITGRMLLEQGKLYANALTWAFGSPIYAVLVGVFDQRGGLLLARGLSIIAGLVTVLSVIFMTLGLFKVIPGSKEQARADFAISSRPVMAALLAGLVVAIMPTAIALSRFATYDATAIGWFAAGCAVLAWAVRESRIARATGEKRTLSIFALFLVAATLLFLGFLTKYVIALFFPVLCILIMLIPGTRIKGIISFVLPLSLACLFYYITYSRELGALLQFAGGYKDLRTDDWFREYFINRFDILLVMLFGYWGLRQAIRNQRSEVGFILWGGTLAMIVFQFATRADFDYWKHSVYIILMLAPLIGWLWADWTWWDEPFEVHSPRIRAWWGRRKAKAVGYSGTLDFLEQSIGGNTRTERPGSYSLMGAVAAVLLLIGLIWSTNTSEELITHWPSVAPGVQEIKDYSTEAMKQDPQNILVDDSGLMYYMYTNKIPVDKVVTPFFIEYQNYKGLADPEAYALAVRNQQYSLVILDGAATNRGYQIWQVVRPILEKGDFYEKVYEKPLDSQHLNRAQSLEIYRLMTSDEQKQAKSQPKPKPVTQPATPVATPVPQNFGGPSITATAVAAKSNPQPSVNPTVVPATTAAPVSNDVPQPTPTTGSAPTRTPAAAAVVAQLYPENAAYDFSKGDEGWGLLPDKGELQPGAAVAATDAVKLENHSSLKFTPVVATKNYTVGINREGKVRKVSLFVYIPADKAGGDVRMGMYYFTKDWKWNDDTFQTKVTPGQWTELKLELPEATDIRQFGLKLVGFSGSIYINGVSVE